MDPIQRPTTMSMSTRSAYDLDLRDVRGQIGARRALEIAAAGGHNVLMIGPAGCGKTMLAVRLPALLPVADGDTECPYSAPHHTASALAMFGGTGEVAQPGEVSRADGGMLFLDELPEFSRTVLGGLREPLERRAAGSATLPARFQLVAAMEPCPCGECDERQGTRRCTAEQMERYHARVAGTIGEHLHVVVEMGRGPAEGDTLEGEASAPVRARIAQAQRTQRQRCSPCMSVCSTPHSAPSTPPSGTATSAPPRRRLRRCFRCSRASARTTSLRFAKASAGAAWPIGTSARSTRFSRG